MHLIFAYICITQGHSSSRSSNPSYVIGLGAQGAIEGDTQGGSQ